jgi:hypothetical protein
MFLTIQDLKVDQTYITSESTGILISNINIPVSEFGNLDNILNRVKNLISQDYSGVENKQFQVCATYLLRNTKTGELRQWSGSFNPKGNQYNSLCQFQTYNSQFKTIVKNACSTENIFRKLRYYHIQTDWVFDSLTSIIISVQAVVDALFQTLIKRNLIGHRHGRKIQTFYLP